MALELADIFRQYGSAYRQKYTSKLLPSHRQAMRAIEHCRTEALGGQVYRCASCGETRYSYHSCRNRHCPKCQHEKTEAWLEGQRELLLPVPYFLLTFTLPRELRALARDHARTVYGLLMRCAAATLQTLAGDPRYVGGRLGCLAVLHTWTRALLYHPHVHLLVTAGGLSADGTQWVAAQHPAYLVPVQALSGGRCPPYG